MAEPVVDEEYLKEIEMARSELRTLITSNKCAPFMLQLAWNDAATYDAKSNKGGPNGSIRLRTEELKKEENMELDKAVQYCEIVKTKLQLKKVSYADLYQLAGVVAVEVTEGPNIHFVPGRKDSNECPRTEWRRFLNGKEDARNLRSIFAHMGIDDEQDIVALCGGHTLIRTMYPKVIMGETPNGKTHKDSSKFEEGKWTNDPLQFNNSYSKELLSNPFLRLPMDYALAEGSKFRHFVEGYAKGETPSGKTDKDHSKFEEGKWTKDPLKFDNSYFKELLSKDASFSRLPMDYALVENPKFRHYVERYAKDENIFFKEYAISHKKLSELGYKMNNLNQPKGPYEKLNEHKGLIGIGIVSVVVTMILGYLLKRKKNQLKN